MNDTDHPKVRDGQPTWAQIRHGACCPLPRRLPDGTMGVLSTSVPIDMVYAGIDDQGRKVWRVTEWSPGAHVEIGPLPPDVVVEYLTPRPNHAFLVEV